MIFEKSIPITILPVFAQQWTGGQEASGSGLNVYIPVQNFAGKDVVLKEFYFRGQKAKLEQNTQGKDNLFVAHYISKTKEVVLHNDKEKEVVNEPPILQDKRFQNLANDEGVLIYTEKGNIKHYKVTGIKDKFPIYYPSAPPKKQ